MSGHQERRSPNQGGFLYQPAEWLLDCSFVAANAPGLALGALELDEVARINHHVSWCPDCAKLVHEHRKLINALPFLSPQASPSPSVRSALFSRIETLQQLERTNPKELWSSVPATTSIEALESPAASTRRGLLGARQESAPAKRRVNWEMIVAPLAAVPLVVALAIVGGWALRTQDRLDSQVARASNLEIENADLVAQVGWLSNTIESQAFELESVDSALGGAAKGRITARTDTPWAMISVWGLPSSATGYQVLVVTDNGDWIRALEFTPDAAGSAERELKLDAPLDEYTAIHVQPMQSMDRPVTNDSASRQDVLWMDLNSKLGSSPGTEANAKAH